MPPPIVFGGYGASKARAELHCGHLQDVDLHGERGAAFVKRAQLQQLRIPIFSKGQGPLTYY